MASIRSRKHSKTIQPLISQSLLALVSFAVPFAVQAQTTEQTMPEVKVKSTVDIPYKTDKVSSPKLTQPLVNTTQTISVIKKELLREQGATSIMEALRNTPGITMQLGENGNTSAGDTFQMRGFSAQSAMFVDGIRDLGAVSRDSFNIEQVEIAKGPAGADIGRGAVAGYINLVSKTPYLEEASEATASWNTGNNKRLTLDINKIVGDTSAVRLNVMGQRGGVIGRDHLESNSKSIAPSLALGLGTPTRFYFYSLHNRQDNVPDGGVSTVGLVGFYNINGQLLNAPRVTTKNYYGSAGDYEKMDTDMATARVEHDLSKGITLRNISRYGKSSMDRILTGVGTTLTAAGAPSTWAVNRSRQSTLQENKILANQSNVTAEFATGGVTHSLSAGLEFIHEKQLSTSRTGLGTMVAANLYNPDWNDAVTAFAPVPNGAYTDGSTMTTALYVFDTLKFSDRWQVNGGLRAERYDTDSRQVSLSTATSHPTLPVGTLVPTSLNKKDNLLSWKAGVLYKPAANGSVYASVANSLTPPGGANFSLSATAGNINGPGMEPQKSSNIELGTKWELLDDKLALTAAFYRTENKNEITLLDALTNTYAQLGKRRVEGFEFGVMGQFTPAWQVSAGIATMKAKIIQGTTGNNSSGAATRWSPDLTATIWTTYNLSSKWSLGGGARFTSDQKRVIDPSLDIATQNLPKIPAYSVADAMLSYNPMKNLSIRLNVYNLFDKFYIGTLNSGGARYTPGAPRSALLSANLLF